MPDRSAAQRTATVRFRITAVAVLAATLVLCGTAVAVVVMQRRSLTESLDEALGQELAVVGAAVSRDGVDSDLDPRGDDELVAQLVVDGEVVARSRAGPAVISARRLTGPDVQTRTASGLGGLDGDQRIASRAVSLPNGQAATLHLAAPLDDVQESTRALSRALLISFPLAIALLGAVVWWLVGRTLRPVEDIRQEVASIGGDQVERRVPEPAGHDEIARLARTMNEMLDRIEVATSRQKGFAADASHELRTPLARMRAELEVDLAHPETANPTMTHRSVLEEVDGLQRLISDLLLLARFDATSDAGRPDGSVDLAALVGEEIERTGHEAITMQGGEASQPVRGDADQLRRVVRNLLDNAVGHAQNAVVVSFSQSDGRTTLVVDDDGPGIPAERRDQVFERLLGSIPPVRRSTAGRASAWPSCAMSRPATAAPSRSTTVRPAGPASSSTSRPASPRGSTAPRHDPEVRDEASVLVLGVLLGALHLQPGCGDQAHIPLSVPVAPEQLGAEERPGALAPRPRSHRGHEVTPGAKPGPDMVQERSMFFPRDMDEREECDHDVEGLRTERHRGHVGVDEGGPRNRSPGHRHAPVRDVDADHPKAMGQCTGHPLPGPAAEIEDPSSAGGESAHHSGVRRLRVTARSCPSRVGLGDAVIAPLHQRLAFVHHRDSLAVPRAMSSR
ncbi:MAG: ATP-binding protein [Acidimicrobiales bacterium]